MGTSLACVGVVSLCLPDIRALRRLRAVTQAVASASPTCPAQVIAIDAGAARVAVEARFGAPPGVVALDLLHGPVVIGDWLLVTRGYAIARCSPPSTAAATAIGHPASSTGGAPA